MAGKSGNAQIREVVRVVRLLASKLLARGAHVLDRESLRDARTVLPQPSVQPQLRARDHRLDIPQCIIEIEGHGADVTQH